MTLRDDHGDLPAHTEVLLQRLDGLSGLSKRVRHGQHLQHAERSRILADHLRGVLALSSARHYAAAFVVARSALEHHLLDRLVFLATRWIVVKDSLKASDVPAEVARLEALKASSRPNIVRWWYEPKTASMNIVYRGVFRKGSLGRGWTVSHYYFRIDHYDPFTVHKNVSSKVATGFDDPKSVEEWAAESAEEWSRHFVYRNLRKNLDINWLLRPRLGVQVDVHYNFLSAYAHGAQRAYELVYGHNSPSDVGRFNHFASELALLYVVVIAAAELEVFGRMAKQAPRLGLVDWSTIEAEIAAARASSSYFWFLSGEPHAYDRIEEFNTRIRLRPGSGLPKRPRVDPASLDARSIRYYSNPLERLVKLHHTSQELMTWLVFQSPFDRPDIRR